MSTYTLRKVEELNGGVPWTSISDADLMVVKKGGVDGFAPFSTLRTQVPNLGYLSGLFDNTDLNPSFIWTLNHAKNTRNCFLLIKNPAGEYQNSLVPYLVDANNIAINFGGAIDSGDWEYTFIYFTAAADATYPDPTYALAVHNHIGTVPVLNSTGRSPYITLNSFEARKYGTLIVCTMRLQSTNSSDTVNLQVGELNILPDMTTYFTGNTENTAYYEGAVGMITTSGIMSIRLHVPNIIHRFLIVYPSSS